MRNELDDEEEGMFPVVKEGVDDVDAILDGYSDQCTSCVDNVC